MATFNLVIRTVNTKKNGKTPIFLRIRANGKDTYVKAGFDIYPNDWIKAKGLPRDKRLADYLNNLLLQVQLDYAQGKSVKTIVSGISGKGSVDFEDIFNTLYSKEKQRNMRNANAWKTAVSRYRNFLQTDKIILSDFSIDTLQGFKEHLLHTKVTLNTVSVYMRTLRAVYKRVCAEVGEELKVYPFPPKMVPKPSTTAKRSISIAEISDIYILECKEDIALYRDAWILMFCLGGIDILDISKSKPTSGKYLYFRRNKTGGRGSEYKILITKPARDIMQRYLSRTCLMEGLQYVGVEQHRNVVKRINYAMRSVQKTLGISQNLTTKVARHTFSTIARNMGYDKDLIGVLMGHELKSITDIYIRYSQQMLDEALMDIVSHGLSLHLPHTET
jgi:integrase